MPQRTPPSPTASVTPSVSARASRRGAARTASRASACAQGRPAAGRARPARVTPCSPTQQRRRMPADGERRAVAARCAGTARCTATAAGGGAARRRCARAPARGAGRIRTRARAVWRTSEVSAAAPTPLPVTSPITSSHSRRPARSRRSRRRPRSPARPGGTARRAPSRESRERVGQQAVLQRARDRRALAVQARVLDGERRARGDLLGELEVAAVEAAPRTRRSTIVIAPIGDRGPQRHDQHGAHADLAQQAQVLLVDARPRRAARRGCRCRAADSPVRMHEPESLLRVRAGRARRRAGARPCATWPGRRGRSRPVRAAPSSVNRSTAHQSASCGTARPATLRSVCW